MVWMILTYYDADDAAYHYDVDGCCVDDNGGDGDGVDVGDDVGNDDGVNCDAVDAVYADYYSYYYDDDDVDGVGADTNTAGDYAGYAGVSDDVIMMMVVMTTTMVTLIL